MIKDIIKVLEAITDDPEPDTIIYVKCPLCGGNRMKIEKTRNGYLHIVCYDCCFSLHE